MGHYDSGKWLSHHEIRYYVDEYLAQVGMAIDQTQNLSHEECDGGIEDRKARLYITRTASGWVAYCHNCGKRGFLRTSDPRPITKWQDTCGGGAVYDKTHARSIYVSYHMDGYEFRDLTRNKMPVTEAPCTAHTIGWFYNYFKPEDGFREPCEIADSYGVKYTVAFPSNGISARLLFPVWDVNAPEDALPAALAERTLEADNKWKLTTIDGGPMPVCIDNLHNNEHTVVIVEDRVSSIRLSELGYASVCLHGTNLSDSTLFALASGPWERYIVWLDNDSSLVKDKACDYARRLRMYLNSSKEIIVDLIHNDPKNTSVSDINAGHF